MREEGLSESQKVEKRQQHAVKETEFLRLKRARLGVEDFTPIKVIGKGAFGEVRMTTALQEFYVGVECRTRASESGGGLLSQWLASCPWPCVE